MSHHGIIVNEHQLKNIMTDLKTKIEILNNLQNFDIPKFYKDILKEIKGDFEHTNTDKYRTNSRCWSGESKLKAKFSNTNFFSNDKELDFSNNFSVLFKTK